MKILLIQFSATSNLYTPSLANALNRKNHDVIVLIARRFYNRFYGEDVNVIVADIPLSYMKVAIKTVNPLTFYKIVKIIKRINPDVIHVTNEHLWNLILFPLLKKYPLTVTIHEPVFRDAHRTGSIIRTVGLRLEFLSRKFTRKWGDAFITHGEKTKKVLLQHNIPSNKIWCVPHGAFSDFTSWKKDNIKEEKAILFFGLIKRDKGLEYLIKAEPMITHSIPDAKIIIAGDGDLERYENLIKNKGKFEIHNKFIQDDEVASLFTRASLVVLPYIGGTQSGVIGIAYSFKKPVVVTDVGNIPEQVEDEKTGFIIPPRDARALAEAIIKLLKDDKLREKMGENAYKKMKEELSWGKIAEKTIEIYKGAIANHKKVIM